MTGEIFLQVSWWDTIHHFLVILRPICQFGLPEVVCVTGWHLQKKASSQSCDFWMYWGWSLCPRRQGSPGNPRHSCGCDGKDACLQLWNIESAPRGHMAYWLNKLLSDKNEDTTCEARDRLDSGAEISRLWSKRQERGQPGWEVRDHSRFLPSMSFSGASCHSRWGPISCMFSPEGLKEWGRMHLEIDEPLILRPPRKTNPPAACLLHLVREDKAAAWTEVICT